MVDTMQLPPLNVNEVFGPTIQGEGPDVGKPCLFVRMHGCPVHCPGCDTSYTWNGTEKGHVTQHETLKNTLLALKGNDPIGLVVSGGEPLIYYQSEALLNIIRTPGRWTFVGLETSGYAGNKPLIRRDLRAFLRCFTTVCLSPKITPCLHGQQKDDDLLRNCPMMAEEMAQMYLKFVVKDINDITAILNFRQNYPYMASYPTYLMPYGNDRETILKTIEWMIPHAARYGFIITPRLQALLWGLKRGV